MLVLGYILAILVGITLGLVGSGGTILTVPILVYVMGVDPVLATTYSLFAIGVTSLVGSIQGIYKKEADIKKILLFGLPSLLMVFITRSYILPLVPEVIVVGPWRFAQDFVLMLLFAFVMLVSGFLTIRGASTAPEIVLLENGRLVPLIIQGIIVGLITGVVGAGGGFLIIPALVNIYGMSMKRAVTTSLVIISINSFFGILGDIEKLPEFDWSMLLGYTALAIIGIFLGFKASHKIHGTNLRRGFGFLLLLVAIFIIAREVYFAN